MLSSLGLALAITIGISLGFFGGGGSILTVPLLVYVFGLDPKQAIASSLLVVGAASAFAALQHARAGNVDGRAGLAFGTAGMLGAYAGGRASAWVDGALLLVLFASMMILTAMAMWRGRRAPAGAGAGRPALARLAAQGLGVGLFTGLVGAGGGFLIVPALVLWAGLPMPTAVGTSLLVIVLNSAAGFAGYARHVDVDTTLVAAITATAIGGSFVGARLARRVDPNSLRRAFAGFVLAMAAVILVREADTWLGVARDALPRSIPELVFVVLVLGVGIATGRAGRAGGADPIAERVFSDGAGI
jgi:uncharacterized membrane protein YfcA